MSQKKPGDSNQITREYFDSLLIEMRHIDGVCPSTQFKLYGETFRTPVMTAALSHLDNVCPDGMEKQAEGALRAGAVNWAGMGDEAELERIVATGARTIKIIKPYEDNDYVMERIRHACSCGCLAVGMDLDHSFNGRGEPDEVCGYRMKAKSLEELKAIRDKMQNQVNLRDEDTTATRIVVGMATCGIAAGARPVLTAFSDLAQQKGMKNVVVTQTGCVGLCQYEPIVEILEPGKEKVTYINMNPEKAAEVFEQHIVRGQVKSEYTISSAVK